MSDDRPKRGSMSLEEATVSNMREIAAIVELLEQKGLCAKQDFHTIIDELRGENPRARIPGTAFPEPYLLTEIENKIIEYISSAEQKRPDFASVTELTGAIGAEH
ncbi:MAG TPA: hypothetical protein VK901_04230 [Nitrospiraceae bacterium]|nr:hypothetical protein [Nitrospiraceae bacterium]